MIWQFPLILRIIVKDMVASILVKKIAQRSSRTRNLVWQYFFSALFATTIALIVGTKFGNIQSLGVMIIGAFNAFACYCQWRAVAISLSKTSLFTQADDLTAMALGYIILTEGKFLTPLLIVGIIICIGAVFIFVYNNVYVQKDRKQITIFGWIVAYSIIWGVAAFSMRYFYVVTEMPIMNYIASWYQGSLIGAFCVFMFSNKSEKGKSLSYRQVFSIIPLSITIVTSLILSYWTKMLAPIAIVQPIFQASEIIFPTLVGLYLFKEIKGFNNVARIAMIVSIIGGLIVMFSF